MNKQKGIIMGILALAVTMMVGYALFSETITINGTATAKGSFNIDFACELMTEEFILENDSGNESFPGTTGGTGTCTIEGNTIKTKSTLNKPTDRVSYKVTLTNSGTIPAVLKTVDSSNNVSENPTSAGDVIYYDKATMLSAAYTIADTTSGFIMGDTTAEQANITIQPNETITLLVQHTWADANILGLVQPKLPEAGATMNYNVTLGFEQATAN